MLQARRVSGSSGQASIEWVAVVAVVATVLATVGTAYAQAGELHNRITRAFARAICVVTAGDCWRDREPCVVGSREHGVKASADLLVIHVGKEGRITIEQRSDGSFAVTRVVGGELGGSVGVGVGGHLDAGSVRFAASAELRASEMGLTRHGKTWIVPSRAAADRLVKQVLASTAEDVAVHLPGAPRLTQRLPPPDISYDDVGLEGSVAATLGLTADDQPVAGATAKLSADTLVGARVDRRTGHRTVYVSGSTSASAEGRLGDGLLGVSRSSSIGGERYAVELDEHGRPLSLAVLAAGRFDGSRDLPDVVQPVAGKLAATATTDRTYEVESRLDLTDAGNMAALHGFLGNLVRGRFGPTSAAAAALRGRLADHGTVEARVVDQQSDAYGAGAHVKAGLSVGVQGEYEHRTARLLAAESRGLDGAWITRDDCLARA